MIRVELVEDFTKLVPHAEAWNALLRSSASDCVFLSWEWIDTWWQVYGPSFELFVLLLHEDPGTGSELVGIAPLMIRRGAGRTGQPFRTLMYLGQEVDVTPEYLDLIAPRGREAAVAEAVAAALTGPLRDRWEHLSLERVLTCSSFLPLLEAELARRGLSVARGAEIDSPYATLAPTLEEFLAGKSASFKKQFKNKRNRLQKAGALRLRFAAAEISIEEALATVVRLNRERWQEAGSSFRSERYTRFHRTFCERIEPKGWLALVILELDGKPIAGRYDYVYGGKLWCYQGGWDPAYKELNVGDNLIGMVIDWGMQRGLGEYDFLAGAAAYKDRWANGHRALVDLTGYNVTPRARAFAGLRRARALAREAGAQLARARSEAPARARSLLDALRKRLPGG